MRAITLWQPWASWIAEGWKTIETRTHRRFACLVGERIAIHAGRRWDERAVYIAAPYLSPAERTWTDALEHDRSLRGVVVCTAHVRDHRRLHQLDRPAAMCHCDENDWGLILADIVPLAEPLRRARGHQGIWEWTPPPGSLTARLF